MELVVRNCPECGSSDQSHIFAEANFDLSTLGRYGFASRKTPELMHYRLVECPECDLAYASPLPKVDDLASAYEAADFDSSVEARCAARTYGAYVRKFVRELSSRHGAIDIGTGDGVFLEELLALGFDNVVGVEPSTAPIEAAKPEIRPLIRHEMFAVDSLRDLNPALITCFQTIEHVFDPLQMCRDAHELLAPGGALFLIGHNRKALSARVLKNKSPIYDIEHLQLFSARSMSGLLQRAGFQRVRVFRTWNRYPLHYLARIAPCSQQIKSKMLPTTTLGKIEVSLPLGNLGVVGFK